MIDRKDITGLVLAGGLGSRMGGVDKGLQTFHGEPLAQRALHRLRPQVGPLLLNANRNLAAHRAFGVPVCEDTVPGHPGPLAGFLAGLLRSDTEWLLVVPCDVPGFPMNLAGRLARAAEAAGASLSIAASRHGEILRPQPVFCLLQTRLGKDLADYLAAGGSRVFEWTTRHGAAQADFDDPACFANINTLDDLECRERCS